jgi:CHASE2 domain-containing sensor protein
MLGAASYLVVLNLGTGSWQQGFATVTAQLWEEDHAAPMQFTGSLPAAPQLATLYQKWRSLYESLYAHLNWRRQPEQSAADEFELDEFELDEAEPTYFSQAEFDACCQDLQQQMNQWLNSDSFRPIERHLRTRLSPTHEIRLMIVAHDISILRLPWSLWDFLVDYPQAEIALSPPEYARSLQTSARPAANKVRILAIVGNAEGIDVEADQAFLRQLPHTDITWLIEPKSQQVNEQLWKTGYDILFFAGHTSSGANTLSESGYIDLNATERLSIEQLKYGLRTAISQGLKLAIFNSCDGLGLARALAELYLPQVIVMREPVPDRVAQAFLKYFLTSFTAGESLYLSVRSAREQLQAIETEFPCATWLPVICQNPAERPPRWQDWCGKPRRPLPSRKEWRVLLLSSLAIAAGICGLRWLGGLQPIELWAFDRLMQLRPVEAPDDRLLVVKITESDIRNQDAGPREASLSDRTLDQLLSKLEQQQPLAIGLDLYRDFAATQPTLANRLRTSDRLIAICKRLDVEHDPDGIVPPPEVPPDRVGFSDFVQDLDRTVRRQILFVSAKSTSPCSTPYSLSTQLTLRYLHAQGIDPSFTPSGDFKFNQTIIPRIASRTSGYQGIDARGNQILLNYRAAPTVEAIAPQVTVTQVLNGDINPDAIKNRIILIGVAVPNRGDYWITSYGNAIEQRLPGVLIHAHMISQLLSAVLDRRPLLWTWSSESEIIWITLWALTGSAISWRFRQIIIFGIILGAATMILIVSCFVILIQGGWIPLVPSAIALVLSGGAVSYILKPLPSLKN